MSKASTIVQRQLKHDAPYAWFLYNEASSSPIFRSTHLSELLNRLESYLTCLEISHNAQQSLLAKINPFDWGAVFIIALVALRTNDSDAFAYALDALKNEQQVKELRDALCRVNFQTAKPFLDNLLVHENPLARSAAIGASGFFTKYIEDKSLRQFLSDSPPVIIATLKIMGKNKLYSCQDAVSDLLVHNDQAVRFHAAYAGSLLGMPAAIPILQRFCFKETPHLRAALGLLYHVIDESEIRDSLTRIHKSGFSPRIKAHSIAIAGLPDKIPVLLEWMGDPEYAPIAGEAFGFITGVDIDEDDLSIIDVELCENQEAPLVVKRKKDPWTQGYEEDLPWPDPELVTNWWQTNQQRFQNGSRYLAGKMLTESNLQYVLKEGTQPQRHAASLILAVKKPHVVVQDITGFRAGYS